MTAIKDDIQDLLRAMCEFQAEELERVGKRPTHTCEECKNCKKTDPEIARERGIIDPPEYYCEAKSTLDDEDEDDEYYGVTPDDDTDEHGDWNFRTKENEPCDDFDLRDDISEEKYYESMYDWLNDQLDIEYTITGRGEYKSGTVVTGTGGPHIEVVTGSNEVKGYWGSDRASAHVSSDTIARLDECLEEMYDCMRG